jgi:glutamine amidotransferase
VRIVVCDVGRGNLRSVERALREAARAVGRAVDVEITADAARLRGADKLVMPGQGAFGDCARALARGLGEAVREHVTAGRPYLGICLGLQVLFGRSEEAPGCSGLGLLEGEVVRLRGGIDATPGSGGTRLKIPHVGWNSAVPHAHGRGRRPEGPAQHFYFVHSYVVVPRDARVVVATTEYGERFVSAVAFDNVFACQFHPEKSQRAGLALLERFLAS